MILHLQIIQKLRQLTLFHQTVGITAVSVCHCLIICIMVKYNVPKKCAQLSLRKTILILLVIILNLIELAKYCFMIWEQPDF